MARALHLAARALGSSSPNPAVGAVVVKNGRIVGEGSTQPPGQAHAEVVALTQADSRSRGASLYVTLEPCPHRGRTPPCVDAIVAAGISEVHIATIDPSPWVNGAGRSALEQAGIRTIVGTLEPQARRLNEGYIKWVTTGRPMVTAIYAMSLDGLIGQTPASAHICEATRVELERLRSRSDRAQVGLHSLLEEDPALARLGATGVTSLLIECGRTELFRLIEAGLADKLIAFITPALANPAVIQVGNPDGAAQAAPLELSDVSYERLGRDLMVVGYTEPCSRGS